MIVKLDKEYTSLLFSMSTTFVEIRSSNNFEEAKILADIFHNCPSNIANGMPTGEIKKKMVQTAERHNYAVKLNSILKRGVEVASRVSK
jgi:hypothetical protein